MIAIIDYGVGNVLAFANAFKRLNIDATAATSNADLARATKLILPGVGSFDRAMEHLNESGMRERIEQLVLVSAMPILGVCVGMQMLARSSQEGSMPGLGWINGQVNKFDGAALPAGTTLPHMGWNDVQPTTEGGLFTGLGDRARFYFLHSYYFSCGQPSHKIAMTDYGGLFCSAVRADNIMGVQFHPEKSHQFGSRLLKNFAEI